MGYWGWRPLVCGMFISTWVMGCTIVTSTSSPNGTPTAYPQITLTSGRLPYPTAPPLPPTSSPITITPRTTHSGEPLEVLVEPPSCYGQHNGSLLCLGRVLNTAPYPVSAVGLEVVLSGQSGESTHLTLIEQRRIPSGAFAPYSTFFAAADPSSFVYARLITYGREDLLHTLTLDVNTISGAMSETDGRFTVAAKVLNPYRMPLLLTRAIVTLTDKDGRVIGYRAQRWGGESSVALAPGDSTALHMDVFPQAFADSPTISVYVEGIRIEPS